MNRIRRALLLLVLVVALVPRAWPADAGASEALAQQVQRFADEATRRLEPPATARVEVSVGAFDQRLKLAPCGRIEPYLPTGTRLWGKAHVGVRCVEGPKRWNVYLPIVVHVFGRALVSSAALPAGHVIGAADLAEAEVDLAAEREPAFAAARGGALIGRTLARALDAGQALRADQLKPRQWFAAGETVRISAQGEGFAVSGSGEALSPGIEGQSVRVRVEGGRIVSAEPVGEHEVRLAL